MLRYYYVQKNHPRQIDRGTYSTFFDRSTERDNYNLILSAAAFASPEFRIKSMISNYGSLNKDDNNLEASIQHLE